MADSKFHKNTGPYRLDDIADIAKCQLDPVYNHIEIKDVASLSAAQKGHITFLDNVKYKSELLTSNASACILHPKMEEYAPDGMIKLLTEEPYKAYAKTATLFYPHPNANETEIHSTAVVAETASIGEGCIIEAYTIIGDGVVIGDKCHIGPNVTITHAVIGNNVRVHTGARIGQDGFGFAIAPTGFVPVPQLGRVLVEDNANIGANTCIDRGAGPDTIIGAGTYIDNLVQIGHNVKVGRGCVLVSQVGISGSTVIEDYCILGGQAGVAGHLTIGTQAKVAAQAGVSKDIPAGETVAGYPARPAKEFWRDLAKLKKLLSN